MKARILITGATGNTGLPLMQVLAKKKIPFRAQIHSPEKASLVPRGVAETAVADFGDLEAMERALEGIEKLYLVSPPSPDQLDVQAGVVDLAKRTGVKHIVKLSALGTSPDSPVGLLRAHAGIEEYIKGTGIASTFLRPHFFMENLLMNADSVRQEKALYSPLRTAAISPVSVRDIALVAGAVLSGKGHRGRVLTLTGPATITYAGIADAIGEVIGSQVTFIPVPFDAARQAMIGNGMPEWLADDLIRLMKTWADGGGDLVTRDVENVTGRKPTSIKTFLKKHKTAFAGQEGTKRAA